MRGPDQLRAGAARRRGRRARPGPTAWSAAGSPTPRRSPSRTGAGWSRALAANWRAHSGSGTGPRARRVHDHRGRREVHLRDEPMRLGAAPRGGWAATRARTATASREEAHDWSYGRAGFPLYCTHCSFMNEIAADPLDRLSASTRATRRRTSTAIRASGTGTRTRPTSRRGSLGAIRADEGVSRASATSC